MILVIGCGRLGGMFASHLAETGQDVTVLDWDRHNLDTYLPKDFAGRTISGMEIDAEVLRLAGIEQAEVVVIVSRDEATNMMVADMAQKIFGNGRIVVRIDQPQMRSIYEDAGFHVLSPVMEAAVSLQRTVAAMKDS